MMESEAETYPAPGVMATSPATAPAISPRAPTRPAWRYWTTAHAAIPNRDAITDVDRALIAVPSAASPDPPLKPIQPIHSSRNPMKVIGTLCERMDTFSDLRPRKATRASPEAPAHMWTTVPPAKSRVDRPNGRFSIRPPPQTMWAMGAYTRIDHTARNATTTGNLMRSAQAPRTMAPVSMAKVIWNSMNSMSGIVSLVIPMVSKPMLWSRT